MSKNSKIQTMSGDLDELKNNSQGFSRQAEKEKEESIVKTVNADDAIKQIKVTSASDIVKQVNPKRSMVESVISSMAADGKIDKDKQEKNALRSSLIKTEEERSKNKDISELQDLVGRISKTIPEKEFSPIAAKREDALDKEKLSELNIESENEKAKERINKETERKIKSKTEDVSDYKEVEDQGEKSFWSNISEKLKKDNNYGEVSEIGTVQNKKMSDKVEKARNLPQPSAERLQQDGSKEVPKALKAENKIGEFSESGVLFKNDKKIEKTEEKKSPYSKSGDYVLPENRLIHGKQKFYSSVSKRIKLRKNKKGEMEELKGISNAKKEQKILSRKEEYGKLKKSIISKYHIKSFHFPWKKIVLSSLIIILVAGVSFYYVMFVLTPPKPVPPPPPNIIFGEELPEFMNIEKKITISEGSLRGFNSLEENAIDIFNANRKLKVIKLVVVNTEDKENKNILSLENSFDALSINKNNFPEKFLEMSMDKYNLFIFKTKENHIRYGIAIGLKDRYLMSEIMGKWERERSANKKMITVLKPLFAGDKNYGDVYKPFSSVNYNGVEIKYVHLIDRDTALNYFIYNNSKKDGNDLLVITTSEDSVYTIANLLADN